MMAGIERDRGRVPPNGRLFAVDVACDPPLTVRLDRPRGEHRPLIFRSRTASPGRAGNGTVPGSGLAPEGGDRSSSGVRVLAAADGVPLLCFGEIADYRIGLGRIDCRLFARRFAYLVELRFVGPVMAFWLELQGLPALHASAVVLGDRAVAFLSHNGGGKTSLAATLLEAGHPLLTDDLLAIEPVGAGTPASTGAGDALDPSRPDFLARPGYPQMRMWPQDAERFLGSAAGLERVHPGYEKLRVPIGEPGFGAFHPDPAPLVRLYLVERTEDPIPADRRRRERSRIEPLPPHRAVIELLRHSFTPRLVEAAGLQPGRLGVLARIVERVPVRRLVVPSDPGGREAARDAVLRDLG